MAEFYGSDYSETITPTYVSGTVYRYPSYAYPGNGYDYIDAGGGDDYVDGGGGGDYIYGSYGDDTLLGGAGDDYVDGGTGYDYIDGGTGNDYLYDYNYDGSGGEMYGGAGNDTLEVSGDGFLMDGGTGNDAYYLNGYVGTVRETTAGASGGNDIVYTYYDYTLGANLEDLVLRGGSLGRGNVLDNEITGNWDGNTLLGLGGDDVLDGQDGADSLDGGAGADTMIGGVGDDIYFLDNTGDVVVETSKTGGYDYVNSAVAFTLGANVEDLKLWGTAASGTGNALNNGMWGNGVANTFRGGAGNDTLVGKGGGDTLIGGLGNDFFRFELTTDSFGTARDSIQGDTTAVAFEGVGNGAGDRIDLSLIDANLGAGGNQAFGFGTAKTAGRVWAVDVSGNTHIRANVDNSAAYEFELVIFDGGTRANAYTSADFVL